MPSTSHVLATCQRAGVSLARPDLAVLTRVRLARLARHGTSQVDFKPKSLEKRQTVFPEQENVF